MQEPLVTSQAVTIPETTLPLPTQAETIDAGQSDSQIPAATNTLEIVSEPVNRDGTNPPVALTIISATIAPPATNTPDAVQPTTDSSQVVDAQGTPVDTQFITPSGPLGPITQVPISAVTNSGDPTATPSGLVTPTAFSPVDTVAGCTHTVQSGDTLYRIALKYEVSLADLREANPQVSGDIIQPGDELNVPDCSADSADLSPTDEPTTPAVPSTPLPGGSQTYVVKRGDTLYSIAIQFGVTSDAIQKANNLANPDRISPGQELIIPPKSG